MLNGTDRECPTTAGRRAARNRVCRHLRQYLRPQSDPIMFGLRQFEQTARECRSNGRLPIPRELRTGTNATRFKEGYRGMIGQALSLLSALVRNTPEGKGFAFTPEAYRVITRELGAPEGTTVPYELELVGG